MRISKQILIQFTVALSVLFAPCMAAQAVERFKPFVLAWRGTAVFATKVNEVKQSLEDAGFQIVANVAPYPEDAYLDDLRILVFTSPQLKRFAARSPYGGFAAAQRVSISRLGDDIQVSYLNPTYTAHAYRLGSDLKEVTKQLASALGRIETFGSEKGLTEQALRTYHYSFGMEYFDEPYELANFSSYSQAVEQVETNLGRSADIGVEPVYRIDIPGRDVTVIGVTLRGEGEKRKYYDDHWIMDNVDFKELHTTAYLPYEIMITGSRVIALSMRFRMAVYHPDLTMKGQDSFMNIIPSPLAVKNALTAAVGGTATKHAGM
ncbi:MAG TPA: hypothetical protein ENJ80_11860 [Gammaproteobacteria bacterium]|nr:hypothetical protein [Gammaproteobacteria bacterium]